LQFWLAVARVELQMRHTIARVKSQAQRDRALTTSAARGEIVTERLGSFDSDRFFDGLEGVRLARKKNWKQVAHEAGVSASTLTRMAQGKRPDVDSLAALAAWSGLNIDTFVRGRGPASEPEPLAMISTYLRSDKHLSPEAAKALDAVIKATYERLRGE
jgi:transcriptional regulator with XRE-family HTH domain